MLPRTDRHTSCSYDLAGGRISRRDGCGPTHVAQQSSFTHLQSEQAFLVCHDVVLYCNCAEYHLMSSTKKQTTATTRPTLPMEVASTSRCSCKGVLAASVMTSDMVLPYSVLTPTATTKIDPEPSVSCNTSQPYFVNCSHGVMIEYHHCIKQRLEVKQATPLMYKAYP